MPAELVLLEGGSRLRGVSPAGLRDALECVAGEGMIEAQEEAVKREASQKIADGDLGSEGVSSYVVGGAFLNVTWKTPTHSAPITWIAEELSPSGKWSLIGGDRSALTAQLPLTTNGSFARVTLRRGGRQLPHRSFRCRSVCFSRRDRRSDGVCHERYAQA